MGERKKSPQNPFHFYSAHWAHLTFDEFKQAWHGNFGVSESMIRDNFEAYDGPGTIDQVYAGVMSHVKRALRKQGFIIEWINDEWRIRREH